MSEPTTIMKNREGRQDNPLFWGIISAVITFIAYLPALKNGFVNWDDQEYVYDNPYIRQLNLSTFKTAFTTVVNSNWHPLTSLSFAFDYSVWGLNPFGYHLVNNILHSINTFLVFVITVTIMRLATKSEKGRVITGIVTALLFGLHPLHVESVAWVSERKDVLYAFFSLLCVFFYFRYAASAALKLYVVTIIFFILALLSKPMAVTLPIVLLILDYYPLGRLSSGNIKKVIVEKIPFFLLSLGLGLMTIWAQNIGMAVKSIETISIAGRISIAVSAYIFYIYKILAPTNLAPLYMLPPNADLFGSTFVISLVIFVIITAACVFTFKRSKAYSIAWLYFFITILPVSGLMQAGNQAAADRYTYLPTLGIFMLVGALLSTLLDKYGNRRNLSTAAIITAALSVMLVATTVRQIGVWKDSVTLWSHELSLYPRVFIAHNQRGLAYSEMGEDRKAIEDFSAAIEIDPTYEYPHNFRGVIYDRLGDYDQAIRDYTASIGAFPNNSRAYANRAVTYQKTSDQRKSLDDFDTALKLSPRAAYIYNYRGIAYQKMKDLDRAIVDFDKAISIDPASANSFNNRGVAYMDIGDYKRAIADFDKAIAIDAKLTDALVNRGVSYGETGDFKNAIGDFDKALALEPKNLSALKNKGFAFIKTGSFSSAVESLQKAVKLPNDDALTNYALGIAYSKVNEKERAIVYLKKAAALGSKEAAEYLKTAR